MKLLTKTTLFFITIALFVIFTGGILFYFSFRYVMNREVKRELVSDMHQIIMHPPWSNKNVSDSLLYYLPVHYSMEPINEIRKPAFVFTDTILVDNILERYQPYRKLSYETRIDGSPVRISISKSLFFSDELIEYIVFVTLLLSLILLMFIILLNRVFFSKLWGEFFKTIDIIKDYSISESNEITLPESEINEFNMLNQGFEKMHRRIKMDYQNLKEFIENVSHEIQNPLAIIKSRIDLLQQSTNLDESQAELLQSIQGSTIRLSNLNKSLILLSKIDNNQFHERVRVNIGEIIDLHLENFEDLIQTKNISLSRNYAESLFVSADPDLISIMLLNLLKNSVFHNFPSGTIDIKIEVQTLTIKNSGKKLDMKQEDLFKRFIKSSGRPDSLGLGLAIVKKICDYYQFSISYSFYDIYHIISIKFN